MAKKRHKEADRVRLKMLLQLLPPRAANYIDPDYYYTPDNPASRQPERERARRALADLFPNGPPDAATLSNKLLAKRVNEWLEAKKQPTLKQRTIQRAAGRP
jgi:hypothetical protein